MNLSADMPISVQLKNTTLAGILDESLAGRGLAWRAVGHQIEVGRAPAQGTSPRSLLGRRSRRRSAGIAAAVCSHGAFVGRTEWLVGGQWLGDERVVGGCADGDGRRLGPCPIARALRKAAARSRAAAQKPHRSERDFHLDTRTAHAKAALDAPITVNFARPEALEKIVAYLRSTTRLNLLIDNVALAEDGMSAESEGVLMAQQQPFGAALTSLLDPMELTYRVIDDRTIEITTPKAAARHAEIEFYPAGELLAPGPDGHELVARITRELNAALPAARAVAPPTIEFDAPSKYLIVRAPQSMQHRVESLLGTWHVAKQ